MKLVFILGAGTSIGAGAPSLENFLPMMFGDVKKNYPQIANKFNSLEEYKRTNIGECNVEEFLSFLDFISIIKSANSQELVYRQNLKELIIKTLIYSLGNVPSNINSIYSEFASFARATQTSVITFNWDILLDEFFDYNYGSDLLQPRDSSTTQLPRNHYLLKLHGSMNWLVPKKGEKKVLFQRYKQDMDGVQEPLIIPPTYMKFYKTNSENEKLGLKMLGEIWFKSLEELSTADCIFIIGFSFPEVDQHFKLFLKHAIKRNKELKNRVPEIYVITKPKRLVKEKIEFEEKYNQILKNMEVKPNFYYMDFFKFVNNVLFENQSVRNAHEFERMLESLSRYSI